MESRWFLHGIICANRRDSWAVVKQCFVVKTSRAIRKPCGTDERTNGRTDERHDDTTTWIDEDDTITFRRVVKHGVRALDAELLEHHLVVVVVVVVVSNGQKNGKKRKRSSGCIIMNGRPDPCFARDEPTSQLSKVFRSSSRRGSASSPRLWT